MTNLENFLATVEHRRPDQIIYSAGFTEDLHRRVVEHIGTEDIAGYYGFGGGAGTGMRPKKNVKNPDYSRYWANEKLPPGTTIDGNGVAMVPSGFYHFWGYISPLRNATSLKEIEEYPMHDMGDFDDSHMAADVQKAHAEGKAINMWIGHMYETAWQIRGYEQFLIDTIERPAWAECLLERIFQQNLVRARAAAKAGVDQVSTGDDIANQKALMFSKPTWRKLIHSRWAKVWGEVKSISPKTRIWYHTDGNVTDIIPDLIDAGLDILNPLQPECMDIDEVHRRWGRRLTFDGCIGTQSTMPFGTPDEVRARVKEVIDKYGRNGGLMIAPTHVLEPEVPLENIDAFFAACREYGRLT